MGLSHVALDFEVVLRGECTEAGEEFIGTGGHKPRSEDGLDKPLV